MKKARNKPKSEARKKTAPSQRRERRAKHIGTCDKPQIRNLHDLLPRASIRSHILRDTRRYLGTVAKLKKKRYEVDSHLETVRFGDTQKLTCRRSETLSLCVSFFENLFFCSAFYLSLSPHRPQLQLPTPRLRRAKNPTVLSEVLFFFVPLDGGTRGRLGPGKKNASPFSRTSS